MPKGSGDGPHATPTACLLETRSILRSSLVFDAGVKIENRFLLASTVMRATKKLHIPSTRTEDTINLVFANVAEGKPVHAPLPAIAPPAVIDELITTAF